MRALFFVICWLLGGTTVNAKEAFEVYAEGRQVNDTSKIETRTFSVASTTNPLIRVIKVKLAYELACAGFPEKYVHSMEGIKNNPYLAKGYTYDFEISEFTDDPTKFWGYPMEGVWAWLQANAGQTKNCELQYQGTAGFSPFSINVSIGGGLPISVTYNTSVTRLSALKSHTIPMTNPISTGSGGGGCVQGHIDSITPVGECDPLLIDLGQDGIHLGQPGVAVNFDMDGDGQTTRMQWVMANGNEAFIARDLNGNGVVDNGIELFGNGTRINAARLGQYTALSQGFERPLTPTPSSLPSQLLLATNGFVALAQYDQPTLGGNDDGYISNADQIWPELSLWLDINADGQSTIDEMQSFESAGITQLDITPKSNGRSDKAGNTLPFWSWAIDTNSSGNNKYKLVDVFFKSLAP